MRSAVTWSAILAAAALCLGCASPGSEPERRALSEPAKLAANRTLESLKFSEAGWPQADWWRTFGDNQLDRLMELALTDHPSLAVARARVERAKAGVAFAESQLRPEAVGSFDSTYQRFSESGNFQGGPSGEWRSQNRLAADLAWNIDLWGRNRSALQSALGQTRASEVDLFAARLALTTAIAQVYVELGRLLDQVDVARAVVKQREAVQKLTAQRFEAGIDSRVELTQAEAAVPSARADLAALEEQVALTKHLLVALTGAGPDAALAIARPRLAAGASTGIPANLPTDLVGRRPDLVAARWRVEAAARDIDVARAQFYPNVNLIGFIGFSSIGLSNLISSGASIAGVGPAVRVPLFSGGRLRADLAARRADYDIAVEQYNQSLLDAIREVVDRMTSLRALGLRHADQSQALAQYGKAYDLALVRYREGMGNYLQVLDAEVQLLRERRVDVDLRARALDLKIGLVRSLGGGFE